MLGWERGYGERKGERSIAGRVGRVVAVLLFGLAAVSFFIVKWIFIFKLLW